MPSRLEKLRVIVKYAVENHEHIPEDVLIEITKLEARQIIEELRFNDGIDGKQGDKGDKGDKGDRGEKGSEGDKGDPGRNGTDGKTPIKGKDYVDGKDGKDGEDGRDGKDAPRLKDLRIAMAGGVKNHSSLTELDYASAGHTGFAPALGGDDNYVTDAEKSALHPAVTLDTNANAFLSLSAQAIGLDTQTANKVFASPTTGAAAVPAFRALVAGDIPALSYAPSVLVDTRANILAATATSGRLAYATDELKFYVADGTSWHISPLNMPLTASGTDIGGAMGRFDENYGYNIADISRKIIHNSVFGNYNTTDIPVTEGAFRYDLVLKKLEVYNNAAWRNVVIWTINELDDRVQWSDFVTNAKDGFGNDFIHGHTLDIGGFASEHEIAGGTF